MHDNQAVSRHYGVGQFGTKHNINFIENPASISAKFVSNMFSSISLQFKQYLFINPAFINPDFIPAICFHRVHFRFSNIFSSIPLPFRQYFSSIPLSYQQYSFIFNNILSIDPASNSAILFHQSSFHSSNMLSSVLLLFQQYPFINCFFISTIPFSTIPLRFQFSSSMSLPFYNIFSLILLPFRQKK